MRMVFGVLSLLIVLAIVGVLSKKQLTAVQKVDVPAAVAAAGGASFPALQVVPGANVQQQSQQIQQQFKAATEAALQPTRTEPETK
jgi:Tfp pilus assembly major pilin PilA